VRPTQRAALNKKPIFDRIFFASEGSDPAQTATELHSPLNLMNHATTELSEVETNSESSPTSNQLKTFDFKTPPIASLNFFKKAQNVLQ
jgi:hypothetical protein